MVKKAIGVSK